MTDVLEGAPPPAHGGRWRKALVGGTVVAGLAVFAAVVFTGGNGKPADKNDASAPQPVVTSPSSGCTDAASVGVLHAFVQAWNHRDAALFNLLTADAELDMSSPRQRALPPARHGAYTSVQGAGKIERFVRRSWRTGERLFYQRAAPFPSGVVAVNMLARFRDGRVQHMVEAKFALDCVHQEFRHIVIGSGEIAG